MARKTFKIRGNLAEALDDTVSSAKNHSGELHIEIIPLRKIELDPDNPRDFLLNFEDIHMNLTGTQEEKKRKKIEKDSLSSMVNSIIDQGIINPVVVYKYGDQYRLIAGERRTLASIIAKKTDIPAKILTTKPDQLKLSLIQWIENIEREDLTLWERLRNLEKIAHSLPDNNSKNIANITATNLSQLLGCSLQQGVNYRNLLSASDELRKHIQAGLIKNIEKAALIAKSPPNIQSKLTQACLNGSTLFEMKKIEKSKGKEEKKIPTGRPVSKVNFRFTTNINVAKTIFGSIIKNKELESYTSNLREISWDDPKSIASAFQQLIKLLEQ